MSAGALHPRVGGRQRQRLLGWSAIERGVGQAVSSPTPLQTRPSISGDRGGDPRRRSRTPAWSVRRAIAIGHGGPGVEHLGHGLIALLHQSQLHQERAASLASSGANVHSEEGGTRQRWTLECQPGTGATVAQVPGPRPGCVNQLTWRLVMQPRERGSRGGRARPDLRLAQVGLVRRCTPRSGGRHQAPSGTRGVRRVRASPRRWRTS
jgi:hypothetical protein